MGFFFTRQNYHQQQYNYRHCSLYFFVIVAYLLLQFTNASNNTKETHEGFLGTANTYFHNILNTLHQRSNDNLTTATNESSNDNETTSLMSMFHKPMHMSDARWIFLAILRLLAQGFMIFGGIIPYIPQYLIIKRTQNAEGFSNYVCLTLLVANIIRIEFWFGKHFETPLLLQSIVMIICMLIMLKLWTRVHAKAICHNSATDEHSMSTSKEQLTEDITDKKFTDFQVTHFWRWTTFTSYIQFLLVVTIILSITTWVFLNNVVYIESIGFLAVFCEALLGLPQFVRNFRFRSTSGMSVKMVFLWASGDIFKTVYFILRNAPKQFWLCGMLQISIDIAILGQVTFYSDKYRCCKH